MRVRVQREQTLLVTTELVIWCYANTFIFTNQLELDFGIALVQILYIYNFLEFISFNYKCHTPTSSSFHSVGLMAVHISEYN